MALDGSMSGHPTHYEILGLPQALRNDTTEQTKIIRSAYRRALLINHPDKSPPPKPADLTSEKNTYSIDQISAAFHTLSNPQKRAEYDKELRVRHAKTDFSGVEGGQVSSIGVEVLDLDELQVDEDLGLWFRSCRCGEPRGFLIREEELEEAAEDGEIAVGCKGCSLWLRVLFGVLEDEELHSQHIGTDLLPPGDSKQTTSHASAPTLL